MIINHSLILRRIHSRRINGLNCVIFQDRKLPKFLPISSHLSTEALLWFFPQIMHIVFITIRNVKIYFSESIIYFHFLSFDTTFLSHFILLPYDEPLKSVFSPVSYISHYRLISDTSKLLRLSSFFGSGSKFS